MPEARPMPERRLKVKEQVRPRVVRMKMRGREV